MNQLRVAALQYFIRPIETFDQFKKQVTGLIDTAADYDARLVVFPEYFTLQLLTLSRAAGPLVDQIHALAAHEPALIELMESLARQRGIHIVAGTIPHRSASGEMRNLCHVFGPSGRRGSQAKLQDRKSVV